MPDHVTYPLTTFTADDAKRVALVEALFQLGSAGGTIRMNTGRDFVVESGAFWCMGPGYRGGVVRPPSGDTTG